MKNHEDGLETAAILWSEILRILKILRAGNSSEVSLYLHIDPKRVRKYLGLLARKGFVASFEIDNQKWYKVTAKGSTFAENLLALTSEKHHRIPVRIGKPLSFL